MSSQNLTTAAGPTSTASSGGATGPAVTLEKAHSSSEIQLFQGQSDSHHINTVTNHHTLHHIQGQPMDLAPRGPSVVQLRPVRPVFSAISAHGTTTLGKPQTIAAAVGPGTPIISVNRTAPGHNVTLLPARSGPGVAGTGGPVTLSQGQVQVSLGGQTQQTIPTYQITRLANVRAGGGNQPASITVTPITSNISANIRLAGATVNNGTWIQATSGAQGTFSPIRAATITVGGRAIRPEGKMIHIPHQGSVQHVTQLQMVDSKGSVIKPQLATPIVNIRGNLPGGANSGSSVAVPISPFTIRTANITNLPTIQHRPPTSITTTANQVHKVITQQGHGGPIQLLSANKNSQLIHTIAPVPKLSTVCLTLSTNANLAPNNSNPVVAVARHGSTGPSLIVTPSALGNSGAGPGGGLPLAKVYPVGVGRDGTIMDTLFGAPHSNSVTGGSSVTVSTVSVSTTSQGGHSTPASVVVATPNSGVHGQSHPQHVVVHTPTINVHAASSAGLPPPNMASGSIAPNYFVDKNFMNLVQAHQAQSRPISLEKKHDSSSKGLPSGPMIFTTTTQPHALHTGPGSQGTTVTIPIAPHGTQHLNISTHALPLAQSQQGGQNHLQAGPTQILTHHIHGQPHHLTSSVFTAVSTPSITVTGPTNHHPSQGHPGGNVIGISSSGYSIPTHVISQSVGNPTSFSNSINSSQQQVHMQHQLQTTSSSASVLTVTTTSISNTVGNSSNNNNSNNANIISTASTTTSNLNSSSSSSVTTTSSNTTLPTTSAAVTSNSTTNSLSTATPAQSPNQTKSTHSPRPSILRKRELGDSHLSSRAQRNLSHSLNFSSNNSSNTGGTSASNLSSASASASAAAAANKENSISIEKIPLNNNSNSNLGIGISIGGSSGSCSSSGISILKREFQPPTDESSRQSVGSNSSSGSSTISTTSETAELQMQQHQLSSSVANAGSVLIDLSGVNLRHHLHNDPPPTTSTFLGTGVIGIGLSSNNSHNGMVKATVQGRGRSSSTSKAASKDLDRVKSKDKDQDAVSPRKKPRKQQLTSSELLESASPEIYYQGKGKRFKKSELMDFNEGFNERIGIEPIPEEPPPPKVVYYIKKPHMSLLKFNQVPPKGITNHFQRYCDVKPKEEKRPTISELSNHKNVAQKVGGWRLQHMTAQFNQIIDGEDSVVTKYSGFLDRLEAVVGPNCQNRDLNRLLELLKGNIQRCKVIRDQMSESKTQSLKILEHKAHIGEVISKYSSKRPAKKRDRL